jgi:hypothetical protein
VRGGSFSLALNGGLTLPGLVQLNDADLEVLSLLNRNNRKKGVKNKVTVTHEGMLPLIRRRFPALDVIASCIQSLNPRQQEGYEEKFRKYDYVVPLNQHTTYENLRQYARYADKMILFIRLVCARRNLMACYTHYARVESHFGEPSERELIHEKDLPDFAPCVLPETSSGCYLLKQPSVCSSLVDREEDIAGLMGMGVNKFKIPRSAPIRSHTFERLMQYAQQYYRKELGIPRNVSF